MNMLFWIAAATFLLTVLAALDPFRGNRSVRALREFPSQPRPGLPRVSIIVAARNEQRNIREALQSLLELGYPDYELIVVDDRSEDDTGRILDNLAETHVHLKVIHVDALPPGWLGKNHALWVGSRRATGKLLLFTDADIIMEPTVVTRAVAFLEQKRLDHLAATPSMRMPSWGCSGPRSSSFFRSLPAPRRPETPTAAAILASGPSTW